MPEWTENQGSLSRLQRFMADDSGGADTETVHESAAAVSGPPNQRDVERIFRRLSLSAPAGTSEDELRALAETVVARARKSLMLLDGAPLGALSLADASALEAVVHVRGRPALRVLGERLEDFRIYPESDLWSMLFDEHSRNVMNTTRGSAAVRVRDTQLPNVEWVQGTAVMIAPNLALTNRHVLLPTNGATRLVRRVPGGSSARLKRSYSVELDFAFDGGEAREMRYHVTGVPFVAANEDPVDAAVLEVEPVPGGVAGAPPQLTVSSDDIYDFDRLYVVGHPGRLLSVPEDVRLVFGDPDERKCVSFGMLMDPQEENQVHIVHDASTIGGYSGGGVHQFDGTDLMALHYWGDGINGNRAIAAQALRGHETLGRILESL